MYKILIIINPIETNLDIVFLKKVMKFRTILKKGNASVTTN